PTQCRVRRSRSILCPWVARLRSWVVCALSWTATQGRPYEITTCRYGVRASAANSPCVRVNRRPATWSTYSSMTSRNSLRRDTEALSRGNRAGSIRSTWRKKARQAGDTGGQGAGSRLTQDVQTVPPARGEKYQAPLLARPWQTLQRSKCGRYPAKRRISNSYSHVVMPSSWLPWIAGNTSSRT